MKDDIQVIEHLPEDNGVDIINSVVSEFSTLLSGFHMATPQVYRVLIPVFCALTYLSRASTKTGIFSNFENIQLSCDLITEGTIEILISCAKTVR